jgi:lipoprotein NlpI
MIRCKLPACGFAVLCSVIASSILAAEPPPATFDPAPWQARVETLNTAIADAPETIDLYSQRGDALLFLGRFKEAAADYDRMIELDASRDASHWRRGIALFYAGQYDKAARQFERYHSFDNVDRENGIWRYLCQVKADGLEKARAGLLKYEKDDREPFGDVYRLFAGTIEPEAITQRIDGADITDTEREKRKFYANLYIGLWHAVHDRPEQAQPYLKAARENTWPATAGYGPHYMWHVGRIHHDLLTDPATR